jgi:GAF domain-containing protein
VRYGGPVIEAESRVALLYDVARRLTSFTELDPLLRDATARARDLLRVEGCSLLLLDDRRTELYFPVSSQMASHEAAEATIHETRFPADRGVAGWVLREGHAVQVDDVARDPRFYAGVDRATGTTTRALLCAPLRTRTGTIGVLEVVNPLAGAFAPGDLEFLEALAADVAVACEKARLYERLRGETVALRRVCRLAGVVLAGVGVALAAGTALAHLAWALPLRELPGRPGTLAGVLLAVAGIALARVARGWLVAPTPKPVTPA